MDLDNEYDEFGADVDEAIGYGALVDFMIEDGVLVARTTGRREDA